MQFEHLMYFLKSFSPSLVRQVALILLLGPVLSSAIAQTTAQTSSLSLASAEAQILVRGTSGLFINASDVASEVRRAPTAERKTMLSNPDGVLQIANNLLLRRVLAAEAERDGLAQDPIVAAALRVARDRVLSDARLVQLDAQNTPTDAALDAYARNIYQAGGARFEKPAQTRARQILLANRGPESLEKAKDIVRQLRAGASFEELAKANSIDPVSAVKGGDLGFFGVGQMERPFEDAVNALGKPGDLSEPVESKLGYHIIRLEERREKGSQPYQEVRAQLINEARTTILTELRNQKVQSLQQGFVVQREAIEAMTRLEAAH
jgi:peptidyl-prolyl cis-trans isomerase C